MDIHKWLTGSAPAPDYYRLIGVPHFESDQKTIAKRICATSRELMGYQNHSNTSVAAKAVWLLRLLGRASEIFEDAEKHEVYITSLMQIVEDGFRSETRNMDSLSQAFVEDWLRKNLQLRPRKFREMTAWLMSLEKTPAGRVRSEDVEDTAVTHAQQDQAGSAPPENAQSAADARQTGGGTGTDSDPSRTHASAPPTPLPDPMAPFQQSTLLPATTPFHNPSAGPAATPEAIPLAQSLGAFGVPPAVAGQRVQVPQIVPADRLAKRRVSRRRLPDLTVVIVSGIGICGFIGIAVLLNFAPNIPKPGPPAKSSAQPEGRQSPAVDSDASHPAAAATTDIADAFSFGFTGAAAKDIDAFRDLLAAKAMKHEQGLQVQWDQIKAPNFVIWQVASGAFNRADVEQRLGAPDLEKTGSLPVNMDSLSLRDEIVVTWLTYGNLDIAVDQADDVRGARYNVRR